MKVSCPNEFHIEQGNWFEIVTYALGLLTVRVLLTHGNIVRPRIYNLESTD